MYKLLEVRDRHVGLCGGRGSFTSKLDPEVVLFLSGVLRGGRSSLCKL